MGFNSLISHTKMTYVRERMSLSLLLRSASESTVGCGGFVGLPCRRRSSGIEAIEGDPPWGVEAHGSPLL